MLAGLFGWLVVVGGGGVVVTATGMHWAVVGVAGDELGVGLRRPGGGRACARGLVVGVGRPVCRCQWCLVFVVVVGGSARSSAW